MSSIQIIPHPLCGSVRPPASKSDGHRAVICAALAKGESRISDLTMSADIEATLRCLAAMGAGIRRTAGEIVIDGGRFSAAAVLDCGESGSTLRFLLPVAAAAGISAELTGRGRLPARPMEVLTALLRRHGVDCTADALPLRIAGQLAHGRFVLPGNISSQYISGLLLALPLLGEESEILLTSPLESAGYVDMTLHTMEAFGIRVIRIANGYRIPGGQRYRPAAYRVEGDWSAAAFPAAAGALGGEIRIEGLNAGSLQGDREIAGILRRFGASVSMETDCLSVRHHLLRSIEVDAAQIPDMIPAVAAVAAGAKGVSRIHSAGRLRLKESDRLSAIANALTGMGVRADEGADSLTIYGGRVRGGRVDGAGDHRIVMAFAVLAAYAEGETVITDCEAVAKSYPAFFDDFKALGGICHVL
ncbi:MAG: 3-phosphoshikimate 1-carboxyvinyltransferase [Candidatus Howiella sp.]